VTAFREQPAVAAVLEQFPGAEIVDVRMSTEGSDAAPDGDDRVSLAVLRDTALAEGRRIRAVQDGLVEQGDRKAPDAGQLAKARRFDAMGNVLDCCSFDTTIKERLRFLMARRLPPEPKR
jgi:hypothetical protein